MTDERHDQELRPALVDRLVDPDDVLERNVARLLEGSEPPVMSAAARARVLQRLQKTGLTQNGSTQNGETQNGLTTATAPRPAPAKPEAAPTRRWFGWGALGFSAAAAVLLVVGLQLGAPTDRLAEDRLSTGETQSPVPSDQTIVASHDFEEQANQAAAQPTSSLSRSGNLTTSTLVPGTPVVQPAPGPATVHRANEPERRELPDGSILLANTAAEWAWEGDRHLSLKGGEVMLDVVPGKGRFRVTTPHSDVTVLGTTFGLDCGPEATEATVLRGHVQLANDHGTVDVRPGQSAQAVVGTPPTRRPAPRATAAISWARDLLGKDAAVPAPVRRGALLARIPGTSHDYPLPVDDVTVDVVIEDQMARATIDATFFNPRWSQLEGVYRLGLPADAAVSRLAMFVDGKLMEGGIVERTAGRAVYESIVHRRRDPALMEWMSASEVRLRIFPLLPRQTRRILVSYTVPLERLYDSWQLRLPLPAADGRVASASVSVRVIGGGSPGQDVVLDSSTHPLQVRASDGDIVGQWAGEGEAPQSHVVLTGMAVRPAPVRRYVSKTKGKAAKHYVAARFQPAGSDTALVPAMAASQNYAPRQWVMLYDTSGSRDALSRRAQRYVAERLLRTLDEFDELTILGLDVDARPLVSGFRTVQDLDLAEVSKVLAAADGGARGQTNLEAGIMAAKALVSDASDLHILYLGDGAPTAGERVPARLAERLGSTTHFVGVGIGNGVDLPVLRELAEASGGMAVQWTPGEDLDWQVTDLVAALNTTRAQGLTAELLDTAGQPLEDRVYLSRHEVGHGEEVTALARTDERATRLRFRGTVNGEPFTYEMGLPAAGEPEAGDDGPRWLPRAWARAATQAMVVEDAAAHREALIELGLEHFLVTPFTSLLVLEREAQYRQYRVVRQPRLPWQRYVPPAAPSDGRQRAPAGQGEAASRDGQVVHRRYPQVAPRSDAHDLFIDEPLGRNTAWPVQFATPLVPVTGALEGSIDVPPVAGESSADHWFWQTPAADGDGDFGFHADFGFDAVNSGLNLEPGFALNGLDATGRTGATLGLSTVYTGAHDTSDYKYGGPVMVPSVHAAFWSDPSSFLPALFTDALTLRMEQREQLADPSAVEGSTAARELLEVARAGLLGRSVTDAEGRRTTILDAGVRQRAALTSGLDEASELIGGELRISYPELGLETVRPVRASAPLWLRERLPFVAPTADQLQRMGQVTVDDGAVVCTADDEVLRYELRDGRLSRITVTRNGRRHDWQVRYDDAGIVVEDGGRMRRWTWTQSPAAVAPAQPTRLQLPLREAPAPAAGASDFRSRMVDQLALAAAQQKPDRAMTAVRALRRLGLRTGELVLGGWAILRWASLDDRRALLGEVATDPVGRLLAARMEQLTTGRFAAMGELATSGGFVGSLARTLVLLSRLERTEKRRFDALVSDLSDFAASGPVLLASYVMGAAHVRLAWQHLDSWAGLVERWLSRPDVPRAAGWAWGLGLNAVHKGRWDLARAWLMRGWALAAEAEHFPMDTSPLRSAFQNTPMGQAAWLRFVAEQADRAAETPGLVPGALFLQWAEFRVSGTIPGRVLRASADGLSQRQLLQVGQALVGMARAKDAVALIDSGNERFDARTLAIAASWASAAGMPEKALEYRDRAFGQALKSGVPLASLRALGTAAMADAITLATRPASAARVQALLTEWRAVDPDYSTIDVLEFRFYQAAGKPDVAFRALTTVVDRRPGDGESYGVVARTLQQAGRVEMALGFWRRAAALETTDPTWLLEAARAALALERWDEAAALRRDILSGKWHERFAGTIQAARALRVKGRP